MSTSEAVKSGFSICYFMGNACQPYRRIQAITIANSFSSIVHALNKDYIKLDFVNSSVSK